uniref:Replication factor A C-terminal domain-containing protein n=1 Tax=Lactuca sativa TaxID=4236 RepID=A0A9R1XMN4_LACSA|nr:hypothetical protein LSAT_V11C300113930 [Lactuca sativa]
MVPEMGDHNITFIDDVDALRDDLTLKVRVINLWKHMSSYNKDNVWAIELILLDEKGSKIQATVYKKCLYRFINLLKDGSAFYITNPSVASQKPGIFKLTPQDQKLTFVQDTVVTECAEFSGTKFGFSFVEYESILSFLHPEDTSVDVIGLVVVVSEMMIDNPDKSKHRLTIHIQDASAVQLRVILWGDYAYKMQKYIDNNPPNQHVVVILQFAQITVRRDRPSVNTYFTSSKLFINSDIDEITLFKKSLDVDDRPDSTSNTISVIESKQLSEFDDFLVRTKLKTIAEIFEPLERTYFIIVGTIKGILQNERWFYPACTNCSYCAHVNDAKDDTNVHQSNAKSITYICHNRNCTKTTTSVVLRFMIPIRVQDNTGTITLTMFEKKGKISFEEVETILNFIRGGLKLAFKISVTDFNVLKKNNQYGITRVSTNVDIIEQLENKFTDSQTGTTQSLDIGLGEFESQDNRNLKDAISGTDENITPSTVDKNSATSPMKVNNTTPVLKRNLEEVFNKESNEKLSSSKTPKVSPDGPGKQLLNVKMEKSG